MDLSTKDSLNSDRETPNRSSDMEQDNSTCKQRKEGQQFLSSVQKYVREWTELSSICEDHTLKRLREVSIDGQLKVSKFRSVCWALLLDVLSGNYKSWVIQRRMDRAKYKKLKETHSLNPHQALSNNIQDDPLSQSQQSIWNQHFCDKELCAVIKQDVVRTFPGVEFYRKPFIQEIMINILFCYARENAMMCYRQGMHEILAPILFVLHSDHQAFLHFRDGSHEQIGSNLIEVLNPDFLEEDSYFIFAKIMRGIESYYRINDLIPSSSGYFPATPTTPQDDLNKSKLEVVGQLNFIRDKILAKEDLQLHNHLIKLDIPLPIFGIRWLRLLFGREFPLQDLLVLWDAIFAVGNQFELTNFIVVAMLIGIRHQLMSGDYTTSLTYLMKYPGNVDISLIIRHALHIQSPDVYERPVCLSLASETPPRKQSKSFSFTTKSTTLPRRQSDTTSNTNRENGRKHTLSHDDGQAKLVNAALVKSANDELVQMRLKNIQNATALAAMRISQQSLSYQGYGEHDPGIVDGFLEDSPEVLRIQLDNAQAVMSISRLKLLNYLKVLRKHLPGNSTDEVHQAMDGIEELCSLLKTESKPPYVKPLPVERAFEANEAASKQKQNEQKDSVPSKRSSMSDTMTDRNVTEDKRLSTKSSRTQSTCQSIDASIDDVERVRKSRYEIPDNQLSRKAVNILAGKKEVEMLEFYTGDEDKSECDDRKLVPNIDPSGDRYSPENI
ncbi:TBC1 domain family member 5 [Bradysia coprophila]|uniref:TBC1 domain family member 5 n=1 Tax=Bradysia coprophila TaxID=38358 RepID=UPI00187D8266|nr:TBC1 domain family member 5 [Bradysia coprophila]